ncbi:MAG: hypothetical protein JWP58_1783 [Hymenobacter sp.]|nr:hypothetical protein [Hymenobacter sp.]
MPVTITYSRTNKKLKEAASAASDYLAGEGLTQLLAQRTTPFKDTVPSNLTPQELDALFKSTTLTLHLREYTKPVGVNGAFDPNYPKNLYYNTNALSRPVCEITSTLIHESVHALSYALKGYEFPHSDEGRDAPGYKETAPYWIGDNSQATLCGTSLTSEPIEIEWIDDSTREAFEKTIVADGVGIDAE